MDGNQGNIIILGRAGLVHRQRFPERIAHLLPAPAGQTGQGYLEALIPEGLPMRVTAIRQPIGKHEQGTPRRQGDGILIEQELLKHANGLSGGMRERPDRSIGIQKHGQFVAGARKIKFAGGAIQDA
jgi:hypothetical protein